MIIMRFCMLLTIVFAHINAYEVYLRQDPVIQSMLNTCQQGSRGCTGLRCSGATKYAVYSFTAPESTRYRFSTLNADTTCGDTVMVLKSTCNDDGAGERRSQIDADLRIGEAIKIYVGSFQNSCQYPKTVSLKVSLASDSQTPSQQPTSEYEHTNTPTQETKRPTTVRTKQPTTRLSTKSPTDAPEYETTQTNSPTPKIQTKRPTTRTSTKSPTDAPEYETTETNSPTPKIQTKRPTNRVPTNPPTAIPTSLPTQDNRYAINVPLDTPTIQRVYVCTSGQLGCISREAQCGSTSTKYVVYSFRAPAAGLYQFSTVNSATSCLDTVLSVSGVCNDDGDGLRSIMNVNLDRGQTVLAYVGSYKNKCQPGATVSLLVTRPLETLVPTQFPTNPTIPPTSQKTNPPTFKITRQPTFQSTDRPTFKVTNQPTLLSTKRPTTLTRTKSPSGSPTEYEGIIIEYEYEHVATESPTQSRTKQPTIRRKLAT